MGHPATRKAVERYINRDISTVAAPGADHANQQLSDENTELKGQLQDVRTEMAALAAEVRASQEALKSSDSIKSNLNLRLNDLQKSNVELNKNAEQRATEVAQLKSELERVQSGKEADAIALQVEEAELMNLRERVVELDSKTVLTSEGKGVLALAFVGGPGFIAAGDQDASVTLFDVAQKNAKWTAREHTAPVTAMTALDGGKKLVSASRRSARADAPVPRDHASRDRRDAPAGRPHRVQRPAR